MTEMSMEEEYGPKAMPPVHPGAILDHDFLIPMNMTPAYLAQAIGVDVGVIQGIVNGQEPVSAETALLFSRFFGTSAGLWMGLQNQYDLDLAEDRLAEKLDTVVAYQWDGR
jgi:addiction module HigA family antidote